MRGGRASLGAAVALLLAIAGTGLIAASGALTATTGAASVRWGAGVPASSAPDASSAADTSDASVAGRVAVSAVVLRLEIVPRKARSQRPVEIRATVTNLSAVRLPQVILSIVTTPSSLVLKPAAVKVLRNLAPGGSAVQTWTLCSTTSGTFQLVGAATITDTTTRSQLVTVTLGAAARC